MKWDGKECLGQSRELPVCRPGGNVDPDPDPDVKTKTEI